MKQNHPCLSCVRNIITPMCKTSQILVFIVLRGNTIYFDGLWTERTYRDYNLLNKWNSFCMSIDLPDDQLHLYINGNANMTYMYRKARKLNTKFSERTDLPMVIRLGHYYFDNKPILGTILDFHVWDRYPNIWLHYRV